jgi:hypothetical protein
MRKHVIRAFSVGIALTFVTTSVSVVIGAPEGLRTARQARGGPLPLETPHLSAILGPMPQLDPITRFIAPIDPWEHAALGWDVEALDEDGVPLCTTNHPPATACDPEGPRPFLHAGVDVQPAADRVVHASAQGRVVIAAPTSAPVTGRGPGEGGGIVVLEHDIDGDPSTLDDRVLTVYGHVDPQVATGAIVAQGDPIALTSTVGGSHLHFAVRQAPFDPADIDVYRTILPPEGTSQCVGCYSRPLMVPAFPDRWEDPDGLLRTPSSWLAIYGRGEDAANDVIETDDGYLAFGYTWNAPDAPGRSMAVRRLDREGNIVSQRAYYVTSLDTIRRVERAPDGGVIALARGFSVTRPGKQVPMLLKFDAAGVLQWQRQYEGTTITTNSAVELWWEDIAVTADGGYVVTGTSQIHPLVPQAGAVARLDAAGNVQWLRTYEPSIGNLGFDGKGIAQTADGGFVIVGEYRIFFQSEHYVVKELLAFRIDANGELLWGTILGNGYGDSRAGQIEATPDGGSIVVGYRSPFGPTTLPTTVWILKLDGDGTIVWSSYYGTPASGQAYQKGTRVLVTNDGGYVVGGNRTVLFDVGGPRPEINADLFMMRLDGAGEIIGQRRIDSIGERMTVLGLRAASDGGFLLAGGPEIDCRLCTPLDIPLSAEGNTRFLLAHLDADLETSGGCTTAGDFVGLSQTPLGTPIEFRVGALTATPVEIILASVDTAESRYLCDGSAFGAPPVIETASIAAAQQTVSCDRTEYIEAQLCTLGVTGAQATSPVMLNVTYDSLRIAALVVDGDSTPEENDVVGVEAFIHALNEGSGTIPMLDDGSATNVSDFFDNVTTCYEDPFAGVCTCGYTNPPTFSGDAVSGDDIYTREPPLSFILAPEVGRGCMIEASPRRPMFNYPAGTVVSVGVRAMDHIGNVSGTSTTVIPAGASMSCVGDPCGCCLLLSTNPALECSGLDGMPSADYPGGICHEF